MIQAVYGSTVQCYTTTEEYRINTAVTTAKIRYLCKLTNEMIIKLFAFERNINYTNLRIHRVF